MAKRGRKRKEAGQQIVAEHAMEYGVSLPVLTPSTDRFLSPNEIGRMLSVTGEAVKQWIYQRRLPAVKLANGYWKVKVSDFETFWKARHEIGRRRVLITCSATDPMSDILQAIETLGLNPITSSNYADALLKSLDHHPALFILNVSSTEADPWKLAEKIRATKALRSVPILLVASIDLTEAEADRAAALPAQGVVKRPASPELMAQEIQRALNRVI